MGRLLGGVAPCFSWERTFTPVDCLNNGKWSGGALRKASGAGNPPGVSPPPNPQPRTIMILSYLQTFLTLLHSLTTEISLPETGSFQQHRQTRIRTHSLGTLISS